MPGVQSCAGCRATNGVTATCPPVSSLTLNGRPSSTRPASWLETPDDLSVSVVPMPVTTRVALPSKRL